MAKKVKIPDPVILPDLAVVSFGDMMTLMLTFFVLLFSMSEIRKERIISAVSSFNKGMGLMPHSKSPVRTFVPPLRVAERQARQLRRGSRGEAPENIAHQDPQNFREVFGGEGNFDARSNKLTELGKKRLAEIAPLFVGYNNIIEIRGHTADATFAPANDPLGGNAWDVGYERARNTMAYLIDDCGLDRKRFRITTAADTEPLDRRNPAANRRVEIIMTDRLSTEDR